MYNKTDVFIIAMGMLAMFFAGFRISTAMHQWGWL